MEKILDITNQFPQPLGTSLNRGSTVSRFFSIHNSGNSIEVPREWGSWPVISRFFSIHYTITGLKIMCEYCISTNKATDMDLCCFCSINAKTFFLMNTHKIRFLWYKLPHLKTHPGQLVIQ